MFLALTTFYTVGRFAVGLVEYPVIDGCVHPLLFLAKLMKGVVDGKVFSYCYSLRTTFRTIMTGGTWNGDARLDDICRLFDHTALFFIDWFEVFHVTCVVLRLFYIAHPAEHHHDIIQ